MSAIPSSLPPALRGSANGSVAGRIWIGRLKVSSRRVVRFVAAWSGGAAGCQGGAGIAGPAHPLRYRAEFARNRQFLFSIDKGGSCRATKHLPASQRSSGRISRGSVCLMVPSRTNHRGRVPVHSLAEGVIPFSGGTQLPAEPLPAGWLRSFAKEVPPGHERDVLLKLATHMRRCSQQSQIASSLRATVTSRI
jgi:hypothetical protein